MAGDYQATAAQDEELIQIWSEDHEINSRELVEICKTFTYKWHRWPIIGKGAA